MNEEKIKRFSEIYGRRWDDLSLENVRKWWLDKIPEMLKNMGEDSKEHDLDLLCFIAAAGYEEGYWNG